MISILVTTGVITVACGVNTYLTNKEVQRVGNEVDKLKMDNMRLEGEVAWSYDRRHDIYGILKEITKRVDKLEEDCKYHDEDIEEMWRRVRKLEERIELSFKAQESIVLQCLEDREEAQKGHESLAYDIKELKQDTDILFNGQDDMCTHTGNRLKELETEIDKLTDGIVTNVEELEESIDHNSKDITNILDMVAHLSKSVGSNSNEWKLQGDEIKALQGITNDLAKKVTDLNNSKADKVNTDKIGEQFKEMLMSRIGGLNND